MKIKDKNKKTICTENVTPSVPLTNETIAEIAGVSESLVKKVKTGARSAETEAGTKVTMTEELWNIGSNKLIEEIKRVVNL